MDLMTRILYTHSPNVSLVGAMTRWIQRRVLLIPHDPQVAETRARRCRRLLSVAGILFALVIQAGLLWLLREVISVAHGLMELWLQLANQQLDLVSLYNAIRPH